MEQKAYAVIMAGGRGERFWPLSTAAHPKQMLSLVGNAPMIGMSVDRLQGVIPPERIIIVTNATLVEATRAAAPDLPDENIIGEPVGRDTAAACALGTALVRARDPNGVVCILTADQVMGNPERFREVLAACAARASSERCIVTIGIPPRSASTGFGYIEAGEATETSDGTVFRNALRFVEKPDEKTAVQYQASGRHFWNSGMFIWSVETFMAALDEHCPQLVAMADAVGQVVASPGFKDVLAEEYEGLEKISVDYAVMEKADNIVMAEGNFEWDDVGSWPALANHLETDADGNTKVGSCESIDSSDNVVVSNERLTALIGVSGLVVVQAPGATLVCSRDRAQDVKDLVRRLREAGGYESVL